MSRKTYTDEQKATKIAKAKQLHDVEGKSWDAAAEAAGIARLTLFNWMNPKGTKKAKVGRPKGKVGRPKGKVGRPRKNGGRVLARWKMTPAEMQKEFGVGADDVVAAALRTSAAQKAMFQKIIGWAERELAKL